MKKTIKDIKGIDKQERVNALLGKLDSDYK